jgi:hypothetical protein
MAWRLARSLEVLRAQIDKAYPKRSKVSDGSIGDRKHQSRRSDHNPNAHGVVCAIDITEDHKTGPNLAKLIPLLLKDKRTHYVIYERKVYNPSIQGGKGRPYNGVNAHSQHLHLSVKQDPDIYDRIFPWAIEAPTAPKATLDVQPMPSDPKPAVAPPLALSGQSTEQKVNKPVKYDPLRAVSFFVGRGWSEIAACALVAGLMWESGGHQRWTVEWSARGDKSKKDGEFKSLFAGQWNGPRIDAFLRFAKEIKRDVLDPYAQLAFVDWELRHTTEKRAARALVAAKTIEEANEAAISYWRPGIPHSNERLKIARKLLAS